MFCGLAYVNKYFTSRPGLGSGNGILILWDSRRSCSARKTCRSVFSRYYFTHARREEITEVGSRSGMSSITLFSFRSAASTFSLRGPWESRTFASSSWICNWKTLESLGDFGWRSCALSGFFDRTGPFFVEAGVFCRCTACSWVGELAERDSPDKRWSLCSIDTYSNLLLLDAWSSTISWACWPTVIVWINERWDAYTGTRNLYYYLITSSDHRS